MALSPSHFDDLFWQPADVAAADGFAPAPARVHVPAVASVPAPVPASAPDAAPDAVSDAVSDAAPDAVSDAVSDAAPARPPASVPSLEALHPALWRAHQLGRQAVAALASGFAALDAQLPGGGWPAGTLTELLLPHPGVGELRLLAPVLAALQRQQRSVMWFDPPAAPCAWALAALGLDLRQLVVVHAKPAGAALHAQRGAGPGIRHGMAQAHSGMNQARSGASQARSGAREKLPAADILWALEQALKSGHLGAVLAWLPARLPADALRRLQLAAQAHEGPAFLLRGDAERLRPSAAPLRLLLTSAGPDLLRVALLKRRGPPLAQPLTLQLPAVLSAPALLRAWREPARAAGAIAAGGAGAGAGARDRASVGVAGSASAGATTRAHRHTL